jgi:arsenate reductase
MAEGLLRHAGRGLFDVHSAGSAPRARVHPAAVQVAAEYGIDISGQVPKDLKTYVGQPFDYVITVCDQQREECPTMPGAEMIHWSFPDPAEADGELARTRTFRDVFQGLKRRIDLLTTVAAKASP